MPGVGRILIGRVAEQGTPLEFARSMAARIRCVLDYMVAHDLGDVEDFVVLVQAPAGLKVKQAARKVAQGRGRVLGRWTARQLLETLA
jgi:hypothetical protein